MMFTSLIVQIKPYLFSYSIAALSTFTSLIVQIKQSQTQRYYK